MLQKKPTTAFARDNQLEIVSSRPGGPELITALGGN
jgi:hypothetical protein